MSKKNNAPSPPTLTAPVLSQVELARLGELLGLSIQPLADYDQVYPQFLRQQAQLPALTNFARSANQANQSIIEKQAPGLMLGLSSAAERVPGLVSDSDKVRSLFNPVSDNAAKISGMADEAATNARNTKDQAGAFFKSADQIDGSVDPILQRANTAMQSGDPLVRGQIPPDVLDQLFNSAAFASMATGTGAGSGISRNRTGRDILQTSLGLQDMGLNRYNTGASLFGQGANMAAAAGNLRNLGTNQFQAGTAQLGTAGSLLGSSGAEYSRAANTLAQGGDMERAAFDQYKNVLGTAAGLNPVSPTDMMFTPADVLGRMDANTALRNQETNFNTNLVNYRTTYNNDIENQQRYYNTGIKNDQAVMNSNVSNANAMNRYNYDLMKYQQNQSSLGGLGGMIGSVVGGGLGVMGGPAGMLAGASLGSSLGGGIGTAAGGGGFGGFSSGLVGGLSGLASIGRSDANRYGVLSDMFSRFGR